MNRSRWIRQGHRWLSIVFMLLVIANFVAMIGGTPPAWITYAPLAPLLLMMLTGLAMLGQHYAAVRRSGRNGSQREL